MQAIRLAVASRLVGRQRRVELETFAKFTGVDGTILSSFDTSSAARLLIGFQARADVHHLLRSTSPLTEVTGTAVLRLQGAQSRAKGRPDQAWVCIGYREACRNCLGSLPGVVGVFSSTESYGVAW